MSGDASKLKLRIVSTAMTGLFLASVYAIIWKTPLNTLDLLTIASIIVISAMPIVVIWRL